MCVKVATYCRVSTNKEDQLNSFERQMKMYEDEILLHEDWTLYHAYYDKGLSGTDVLNRPGFLDMKEAGLNREYDVLITREVSRLSRNIQQFYEFIRPLVKKGIQIYFLDDEINSNMPDFEIRAAGLISHAQDESRKTSQRVRRGQKIAMQSGNVFGGDLLGYDVINSKIYINPYGAEIVKNIFDMYVNQNMGIRRIKKELEKKQIKTAKNNRTWSEKSILYILKNEKYCGDIIQGKTCTPDYLTHKRCVNLGEKTIIRNHHEPIIDKRIWEEAQMKLNNRSNMYTRSEGYILSGKIKCSCCGKNFILRTRYDKNRNKTKFWKCPTVINNKGICSNINQLRDDVAMDMVFKSINKISIDTDFICNKICGLLDKTIRNYVEYQYKSISDYKREIDKITEKQKKILNNDLSGLYPPELVGELLKQLNTEKEVYNEELKKIQSNGVTFEHFKNDICSYIKSVMEHPKNSNDYLRGIIERITVYPNRTATVEYVGIDGVWKFDL